MTASGKYSMQDQRVYDWTADLFPIAEQPMISMDEAQALVRHVWSFYRADEAAPLVEGLADPHANASSRNGKIAVPRWGQNKAIVLHEAAHLLCDEGHGPEYVKLVMDLYAMFMGVDRDYMMERAAYHQLTF